MAVLAPIPRVRVSTAIAVKAGLLRSERRPKRRSRSRLSTRFTRRMSRHSSLRCSMPPMARRAAQRASSGVLPAAISCAICCSRWRHSSSSSSCSTWVRRKMDLTRSGIVYHQCSSLTSGLVQSHDGANGVRQAIPIGRLFLELPAAQSRQGVEFRPPSEFAGLPLSGDPALLLELVKSRVQRSIADLQDVPGDLFQTLADSPAMKGLKGKNLENQEIQCALYQIGRFAHGACPRLPRTTVPCRVSYKQAGQSLGRLDLKNEAEIRLGAVLDAQRQRPFGGLFDP